MALLKTKFKNCLAVLFLGLLFSSLSFAISGNYDVVILGGGPSGLAAAFAASQTGARVLLVENRPYKEEGSFSIENEKNPWGSRQRVVAVDASAIELIQKLCQCKIPFSKMSHYEAFTKDGKMMINFSAATNKALNLLLRRDFGGTIKIGELERALYHVAAKNPLIDFSFDSRALTIEKEKVTLDVSHKLVTIDTKLTIVAEGANSSTLKMQEIQRVSMGFEKTNWIVGNFEHKGAGDGKYLIEFRRNASHPFYALALVSNGMATVYASPYDGNFEGKDLHKVLVESASLMGITGTYYKDVTPFATDIDYAKVSSDPIKNLIIIGDAARKADPYTGFGITNGIRDALAVLKLTSTLMKSGNLVPQDFLEFDGSIKQSVAKAQELAKIFHGLRFWIKSKMGIIPINLVAKSLKLIDQYFSDSPSEKSITYGAKACWAVHL